MSAKLQCRRVHVYMCVCVDKGGQDARDTLSKQACPVPLSPLPQRHNYVCLCIPKASDLEEEECLALSAP